MTYKNYSEALRKEILIALGAYHKAEDELANEGEGGGFIDKKYFDKVAKTYSKWQEATNTFNTFLSFVVKNGIDLNTELN